MCSRFEVNSPPEKMIERFGLTIPPEGWPSSPLDRTQPFAQTEVRPTDPVLAIGPERKLAWLSFGLAVEWDKKPLINARMETAAQKATFHPLLQKRCLIPATAYFEWRKEGAAKIKTKISLADEAPFAFAAFFQGRRFAILTAASANEIAHVHHRMPVILPPSMEEQWLDPHQPFDRLDQTAIYHGPFALTEIAPPSHAEGPPKDKAQPDLFG